MVVGTLDSQVIKKFKKFQEKTGKYIDLDIENVEFGNISLGNKQYFEFVKGKNKYIQSYITQNLGDYPILGSSLKNECISNYINPIDQSDIINQTCISFNKDNGKGSHPFYRDYPFLMDRHHIAILTTEKVNPKYLYYSLIYYFEKSKFGWGENVASVEEVQKHNLPIPKNNQDFSSIDIQKVIVDFLEYWKINYTDIFRNAVMCQEPIMEKIKKALIPATFKYDPILAKSFNSFADDNGYYDLTLESIVFQEVPFFDLVKVTNGSEFPAGYVKRGTGEIPLISAGVKKDIMGTIKSLLGNNKSEPLKHYVFNDTKQKWNEVKHYIGKDYYTLTADGEGGNITKRAKEDYPKGFYTTNICKTLEFNEADIQDDYFYMSYKFTKYKYNFDFGNKANNDNLSLIKITLPENHDLYSSLDLQKILIEFWDCILQSMDNQFKRIENITILTDKIDEAFLYRTFSKIEWR